MRSVILAVRLMEGLGRGAEMLFKLLFNLKQPHDWTLELGSLRCCERAHFLQTLLELLIYDECNFNTVTI